MATLACGRDEQPAAGARSAPRVRATVVTIRTTTEPGPRVLSHSIVISGGVARPLNEQDVWRLFDTNASTVTTVDTIEKTRRTEPFEVLQRRRRAATGRGAAPFIPRARVARGGERRTLLGAEAEQVLITAGGYRRELWVAEHRLIPPALFAMMQLSDTPTSPLASMARAVDDAVARLRGFPLVDDTQVPFGDSRIAVRHEVVSIAERDVPASLFEIPRGYRELAAAQANGNGKAKR